MLTLDALIGCYVVVVREVREETGYDVALDGLLSAEAGGSTDGVRWVPLADIGSLPCSPEVIEALQRWRRYHPGGWVHSPTRVTTGE